jgi:hypothetical protein
MAGQVSSCRAGLNSVKPAAGYPARWVLVAHAGPIGPGAFAAMPKRTPLDWEDLERGLHAAGVSPGEIEAGARQLLAQARGHQLAETRKQLGPGPGVSVARVPRSSTARSPLSRSSPGYVEALGGRLDLVADFGDRTIRLGTGEWPSSRASMPMGRSASLAASKSILNVAGYSWASLSIATSVACRSSA